MCRPPTSHPVRIERRHEETRPVQSCVIPLALVGGDVIACAETGTGKTVAFLVPILQRFFNEPSLQPPRTRALVLSVRKSVSPRALRASSGSLPCSSA
jgi:superfamily II DNA/RNA helicase